MGYHPRFESSKTGSFVTTRSRNSELWFVNNQRLQEAILGYAARYITRYGVKLYAFAIEGNHIQFPAVFPNANRADFMRDLNSTIARAVPHYVSEYPGGPFWGRRYSTEVLPAAEDIEEWFFYTVLQPVQDGLVEKISDYPGYNCFHDAIWGITRTCKVINWGAYNSAKRYRKVVNLADFTEEVTLQYERLPGYEHLSQKEYAKLMERKLEERRCKIVEARRAEGKGFAGREACLRTVPGSVPRETKTSTRYSHRPRVLCVCLERWKQAMGEYFERYYAYREASRRYRAGELTVKFPPGTYKPILRSPPS